MFTQTVDMPLPCMSPDLYIGERGLPTAEGKTIKNKQEIFILSALWLLKRLAIIYCPGHQKGDSYKARGNKRTDQAAKEAALYVADSLIIMPDPMLPEKPEYSTQDNKDNILHRTMHPL